MKRNFNKDDLMIKKYITSKKIIYPKSLSEELNISLDKLFVILNLLMNKGSLERVYEFRCSCSKFRTKFENINYINLPNCIYCKECQKKHNLRDNLYIIYKVI